ncbi:MAG: rod-binding protein [Lachnospiraceae bacterium]|nr:rod-binding protein [Lachnospiraceae bacterium]
MSISIGSDMFQYASSITSSNTSSSIQNMSNSSLVNSTDEELMDACREFEAYFIEQLMKQMQKTVMKSGLTEESETESYFKEMLYQEYAAKASEGEGIGIAQMLYEQMKRTI